MTRRAVEALASVCAPFVLLGVQACGREDVELAPITEGPPPVEDCSASVPATLLAARPPMGWNGYNAFRCEPELDEAKLMSIVDALVASGMQSAGYRYVNLDDCWELPRAADGRRVYNSEKLPSGIEALSDSVHARGLSFGVFSTIQDCARGPGAEGYELVDAAAYASWGVDYVKYVQCGPSDEVSSRAVADFAAALRQSGRPIVMSLASAPFQEWMPETVQVWRTSGDIQPTWSSILSQVDATAPLAAYARPGAFNDPDMLELGNGTLTVAEQRAQFSVWSILAAPLLAGNDLTIMTEETRAILTNSRVIALNQDPLGLQAARILRQDDLEVFAKPLAACGARGVVIWNRGEAEGSITVPWGEIWLEAGGAVVRDLWADALLPTETDGFTLRIPAHDAIALRVDGVEPPLPNGRIFLSDLKWTYVTNGFGPVELDRTNGERQPLDGNPIRLRGRAYDKGLGVHGPSLIRYRLGQRCTRFIADVGIDDDVGGAGSARFEVWADGELLFNSGVLTGTSPPSSVNVDVSGRRELRLFVGLGGDDYGYDHSVWAGATLECAEDP